MSIYASTLEKYEVSISGMTCSNCSNYLEGALRKISFMKFANVNLVTEKALIVIDADLIRLAKEDYENIQITSEESENQNNNEIIIKKEINKIGFVVNTIVKINEKENNLNRFLNLIFKKIDINFLVKKEKQGDNCFFINQPDKRGNKIHSINQMEAVETRNIINETLKIELSESALEEFSLGDSYIDDDLKNKKNGITESTNSKESNNNSKFKNKIKMRNSRFDNFEIQSDKLIQQEIDFILNTPGVLDFCQVNNCYRLEYDTSIIKGHELFSYLQENLCNQVLKNYKNLNNEKLKNAYKIIYVNEYEKNTNEIYSFTPTTNILNLIMVIILLILVMSFSMIFRNFDFAIKMRRIFLFGNIDSYLFLGLILSFAMVIFYGIKIYKKAFIAFWKSRLVNMETLIALGSISAIILTLFNLIKLIQESKESLLKSLENSLLIENSISDNNQIMDMNSSGNSVIMHNQMDLSEMTMHSSEAAAAVIAIFIIGKFIEENAKSNIKKLTINLFSDEKLFLNNKSTYVKPANKCLTSFLKERKVDVGLLEKDDFCKVISGDFLLFDCIITKGALEVNENYNYGYDNIVKRSVGDKLKSGCQIIRLLEENTIVIVSEVVEQSMLFKVIKEVSVSLNQKLKFQHFIDKIIKWFVPLIIIISVLTFIVWLLIKLILVDFNKEASEEYLKKMSYLTIAFIFERAISILVVSCPCAFGLAIPTVTTISLNKALKNGILIKNLSILPEIRNANAFVFDKTGTMTIIEREVKIEYLRYQNSYLNNLNINDLNNNNKKESDKNSIKDEVDNLDTEVNLHSGNKQEEIYIRKENKCDNVGYSEEDLILCDFPLYEAIAAVEKSQKHPIAEIIYSFAIRKIQSNNNLNSDVNQKEFFKKGNGN